MPALTSQATSCRSHVLFPLVTEVKPVLNLITDELFRVATALQEAEL